MVISYIILEYNKAPPSPSPCACAEDNLRGFLRYCLGLVQKYIN